jgi:protein-L-isoaspartate(D-aspartate) O-methyltransferase
MNPSESGDEERWSERQAMVDQQLRRRGIHDERVLSAMLTVPRHALVPPAMQYAAYEDRALPIGEGQTISQPYMVARACELAALSEGDRALDVGAGSGYQAGVLARLCERVVAIELVEKLAEQARRSLEASGVKNVRVVIGDGVYGYPEEAPYDAIVVAAGAPVVPPALVEQLKPNGRLVIPLGSGEMQALTRLTKRPDGSVEREDYDACVYVPLRGSGGWADKADKHA